jgi:hypothetical protein
VITITFNPAGEATADPLMTKQSGDIVINQLWIKLFRNENGILPFYLMPYSDLGYHDIWNGVDEHGWAWKVLIPVADGFEVFLVVLQGRAGIFHNNPDPLSWIFLKNVRPLEQDLGAQKSEPAEVVHFEKFRVVDMVITVN